MQDRFVNNGAIQAGAAAAPGAADIAMSATKPATLVNQGSITVQNGSLLRLQPITAGGGFVNAAGAMVSIGSGSGSQFTSGGYGGYSSGGIGNLNTTNNGAIEVTGAAGRAASASFKGSYGGSGLLSVRGTPEAAASDAQAEISGPASGIFDVASGQLYFHTTPVGGGVNVLDGNFRVAPSAAFSGQGLDITTTSTSQAIPAFSYTDNATGAAGTSAGQQYAGPANTLQSQYI